MISTIKIIVAKKKIHSLEKILIVKNQGTFFGDEYEFIFFLKVKIN